ncbi:hypothetical protein K450DRAFT_232217 [Umbelopsis ramanniana AG]|uniref:Myb-like domain-containing protein n=1 Tax=Umbelopsis ramanniana AG TaxID=1314678 RepID=A0AAD5EEB8_UMBRA|nr:uncharacterized protein K450DRAFT_232217 [Umbelopsis ramanniana AG]KAI8581629.1 hypothetical protein K450DRAFT_232217 [Umbelopsis ramanniana AG]
MRNYAMTNLTQAKPTALSAIQQTSLDNKKWILVGAQQAGASPKRMAEIASLPKSTVRRILSNFSRTGIPSTSSSRSHPYKDMAIVEYDSDGKVTNYDDNASTVSQRSYIRPRAKDLIAYVKAQRALEEAGNSKTTTKARMHQNVVATTSHSTPPPPTSEKFQLMTPPQESDTMQRQANATATMIAPLEKSERRFSLPPSPPLHPVPLDTALPSKSLPQAFSVHEPWTKQDDEILLKHVFSSVSDGDWTAIEKKLQGRHRASICRDRWRKLQAAMLDD